MLTDCLSIDPTAIRDLSNEDLESLANSVLQLQARDRNVNQLLYYQPVSPKAVQIHCSLAKVLGVGGGNGASKTDTSLVEMIIRATGQIPESLKKVYPREKLKGPINCRVIVESITNTLETVILRKLQWWKWQGVDQPGGLRGHYGWVPKHSLIKGEWDKSWTARTRTLDVIYRDPDTGIPKGISTIQFMSYDQDSEDMASGDLHFCLFDEPPKEEMWIENMVRVRRVDGTMMLSMTWPDDPTTPVDWIIDRVWEKCQPGKHKDPEYEWFSLYATENQNLNQTAIAQLYKDLSPSERATRIYGQHLRLSNRVHPLFTDDEKIWCFTCHDLTMLNEQGACGTCSLSSVVPFTHVTHIDSHPLNPIINGLDPHPRKPHMLIWVQVTPDDDLEVVHEMEVDGSPDIVAQQVDELEREHGWKHIRRLMDPNMGRSPSSTDRETTWQDAFEKAGLTYDLADDGEAGRQIINDLLKPDPYTQKPRLLFDTRCMKTIQQMKRYSWDDFKKSAEKDQKQRAKQKYDDYPTLLKYIANSNPTFRGIKDLGHIVTAISTRSNGY